MARLSKQPTITTTTATMTTTTMGARRRTAIVFWFFVFAVTFARHAWTFEKRSGSARLFGRSLLVPFPLKTSLSASNRLPARLRSYTFGHVFGRKSPNPRDPATSASDNANLLNNLWHQQQSTSTGSADLSALNSLYSPMIELDATNPFDSMSGYSSSNGFNTYADFDAIFPPDMPNKALPMTQIDVVSRTPTNIESGMNMKPSSSVDRKLGANRALVGFGEPNHRPRYLQSNSYRSNAAKAKQMLHSGTPLTSNLFRISTPHMPHSSAGSAASTVYHLASGSKSLPMLAVSPVIRLLDGEQHVLVKSPISNQPNGQLLVLKSRRPAKGRDLPVALSLTSSATDDLQKWINNQAIEQQFRMLKPDTIKMQSSNHRVTAEPKWPITKNKVSLPATFNGDIITLEDIENALRSGVMAEAFKVESSGGNKAGTTPDHLITSKFSKPTEIDSQFSKQVMSAISFDHHHHHHHHGHHHDAPIVRGQVFDEQIKPNPVSSWSEQVKDRANAAETQTEGSPFTSNTNSNLQVVMPMASANDDRWRPVQVNGPWIRRNQKMSKALVTGAANELQVKMKEKSRIKLKQSDVRSVSSSQTSSVYDQAISQQKETDEQMKETNEELAKQEQEKERPESVSMDRSLQQKETDTSSDEQQEQIDYGFEAEAEQQQSKMDREKESNLKQSKEAPDRPVQQKEEQQKIELSVGAKGRSKKSETKKASLRRPLFGGRKPMKGSSLGDVIDKNARLSSEKEKSAAEEGSYFKQVITPSNAKQYELFTSRPMKEVQMEDQDWVDGKQSAAGRKMKKNDKQLQSTSTDDVTTQGSSTTDNSEEEEEETSEDSRETGAATTASTARVDLSGEPIELVTVDDLTDNEPETSSAGHEAQPEAGKYKGDSDDTYDNDKQDATTVASERVDDGDEPTEEALGERAEESFRSEQRSRLAATTESSLIRSDVQTPSLSLSTSSQPLYTNYDENNYYNGRHSGMMVDSFYRASARDAVVTPSSTRSIGSSTPTESSVVSNNSSTITSIGWNDPTGLDTNFTCANRGSGLYADPDTKCQKYHLCSNRQRLHTFHCPTGSTFDQLSLTCSWWPNVPCNSLDTDLSNPIASESDQVQPYFAFGSTSTESSVSGASTPAAPLSASDVLVPTSSTMANDASDDAYFEYVDSIRQLDKQLAQFSRFQLDQLVK